MTARALVLAALALTTLLGNGCFKGATCRPQQVNGIQGTCSGREGYVWNGSTCVWGRACICTGRDCESVYSTENACGTAHLHCR